MSDAKVTLVIPGRNAGKTIDVCLQSVTPLLETGQLHEIIFVDDGSTDDTAERVAQYPVRCIPGPGAGPGAARNLGWRAASTPFIWFIDSDCVAAPDALSILLPYLEDPDVSGVGGSYGNMYPNKLLACLIHEEIIERHIAMPERVNFLATFNVLYRRDILEKIDGFDERFLKAQDAELSFRVRKSGGILAFDRQSIVKHHHPYRWSRYLKVQHDQGYWRAWLYFEYPDKMGGDSYSGFTDHIQPPLAMLSLGVFALIILSMIFSPLALLVTPLLVSLFLILIGLALCQIPLTIKLTQRVGALKYLSFGFMSYIRAYSRGLGLSKGTLAALWNRRKAQN